MPTFGQCKHTLRAHSWARARGVTLPHCGSASCGVCPGERPPAVVATKLEAPFPVYVMPRNLALGLAAALYGLTLSQSPGPPVPESD